MTDARSIKPSTVAIHSLSIERFRGIPSQRLPERVTGVDLVDAILEAESTLTDRYQTTVPEMVRRVLKLNKRDKIHYTIRPEGEVVISRAAITGEGDPVLRQFLGFLSRDITNHPERIRAIDADFVRRVQSLAGGIEADLDVALSAEEE